MKKENKPIVIAQIMGKWIGGGVEAVIMNYYRHIDRTKVQFDFICDEDSTNIPKEEIESLGGRVIMVPPYQKLPQYLKTLKKIFKENNYKIVHSNINTLSVFPLYAAKKAGISVRIAHAHSTSNPKEWKKNILKNILRPFSKRYATDYFACTNHAAEYQFGKKLVEDGKVKIIYNAIELNKFKFNQEYREEIRDLYKLPENAFVVGHIGRFVEQKNHRFLIDMFYEVIKKNPNSYLIMVGDGPLLEEMKQRCKALNIDKNAIFTGYKSDNYRYYSAFDVFAFPSLYEGLGMVAIEAQVNGIRALLSDNIPEEANVGNGLFLSLSTSSWAQKINEATRFSSKKKKIAIANFDINSKSKEITEIYEELNA